jgi:hypothetical protein
MQGLVVLPRSSKLERIRATAPDKMLSEPDTADRAAMEALDALDDGTKYCWSPVGIQF